MDIALHCPAISHCRRPANRRSAAVPGRSNGLTTASGFFIMTFWRLGHHSARGRAHFGTIRRPLAAGHHFPPDKVGRVTPCAPQWRIATRSFAMVAVREDRLAGIAASQGFRLASPAVTF